MPIPNIPANLLVSAGNGSVYLSWTPSVGASSGGQPLPSTGAYDIVRSQDGVNFPVLTSINVSSFYDTPSTGIVYYYGVRANNASGQSATSQPLAATVVSPGQVTLGQVRLAAQQRADMVNNNFVTTQEWNDYINHSYYELYDILVQSYGDEYYVAIPFSFTTDGRVPALYALPQNMYKLMGVDLAINASANGYVTLKKFSFISRNRFIYGTAPISYLGALNLRYRMVGSQIEFVPLPQANNVIRLWYIPRPTTLLADSDVLDGISGWDEYVTVDVAIKGMQKEESDVSILMAQKQALLTRIQAACSNRDVGQPEAASDLRTLDGTDWSSPFGDGLNGGT